MTRQSTQNLLLKIEELQNRLEESEQLIEAIKTGEVDAFAISSNGESEVYTLQSGDYAYRVLIEELEESAVNITEDGLIVYTNPCFSKLLKLPYEQVIGTYIFDFVHSGSQEEFRRLFKQSLSGKSKGEINLSVDGTLIPVYVSFTSLRPTLSSVGILITDLTEKKKNELIEANQKELQQLVKQAPVSIVLLEGEDLVARVANEAALMVMGKTEQEVLNKPMREYFPEVPERQDIYLNVFTTGVPYIGKEVKVTFKRFGKLITGYYDLNYTPWYSPGGKIKGVIAIGVDVTEKVLARKQIEQNNAMIRNMYMTAPAFVAVFKGPEHVYELVNPYYQALIGDREVIGKKLLDALPELKGQKIDKLFDHVYTTGETVIDKERLIMLSRDKGKEPEETYFNYSFQPIYDEEQKIIGVLAYGTDITTQVKARKIVEASATELEMKVKERTAELEKANRDLIKAKEHFTLLFQVSPVAKSLTTATDGMIMDVNPAWEKMFGKTKEEAIGTTGIELGLTTMEEQARQMKMVGEKENKIYGNELSFTLPGGKIIHTYVSGTSIVLDGVEYFLTAFFDITERKHAEEKILEASKELQEKNIELENSQSFLQQLIDSSVEFISVLDKNLNYITVNKRQEEGIGMLRQHLNGKNLFDIAPQLKGTFQHECILKALSGKPAYLDKRQAISRPNYFVETHFLPLVIQGKIEGVIIMARDVSEIVKSEIALEQKNAELLRTNQELESFNYIASHDLQEPLRKIETFIHLMNKDRNNEDAVKKYTDKINLSAQRMALLIQNVLEYSRISHTDNAFRSTDLNTILDNVKTDFELLIEEKNAIITSDPLPIIKAIPLQMQQLFANLISNSLKFSANDPCINITAKITTGEKMTFNPGVNPRQKFAEIKFIDNGIGFEPQYAEQIFNLFQRLHGRSEYEGTGVGLSIVKKIVEQHKGYINATSEKNQGSTFTLWLPVE